MHIRSTLNKGILLMMLGCCFFCTNLPAQQVANSNWHGFVKQQFIFEGRRAHIVGPLQPLPGNPWVWRAYFPDWHIEMDSILLTRGFHIAYIDCSDMFGSPQAMQVWDKFYDYLVDEKMFSPKPALEGVSRGGLYIYNWAKRNPDKVSCIYAEAPVLDIRSWPGKQRNNNKAEWQKLLKAYQFTDEEAWAFSDNPVDNPEVLAAFKVPVLHVVCEQDSIVPVSANTETFKARYESYGGKIEVVYAHNNLRLQGHHFDIPDPEQYAGFVFQHTYPVKATPAKQDFIHSFGKLDNAIHQIRSQHKLTVAFMGGSITQNPGWKEKTVQYLKERYPHTAFDFIYAGVASLGSVPHAFRLQRDVLSKGKVDLLLLETAVNDHVNGTPVIRQQRALEGIIRQALQSNPLMNIVLMAFADEDKISEYDMGQVPAEITLYNDLAQYYNLVFVNLAREVQQRIAANEFSWKADFKGLHPSPFGQEIYFQTLKALLKAADRQYRSGPAVGAILPAEKFNGEYDKGRYVSVKQAEPLRYFTIIENWKPADSAPARPGFTEVPVLEARRRRAAFRFTFSGDAVGIAVLSGPDAGMIQYTIDGGPPERADLFTQWSSQLHLPWYLVLADNLPKGRHTLTLQLLRKKNKRSKGNACRIVQFLVNE